MDHGIEEPLAPTLGALAVTRILFDVGNHTGIENALPVVRRIKAAIEIEIGPSEVQPDLFGHFFQRVQALRQQHHVGLIDRSHGDGRYDVALVVGDGDDFLAFLVLVPRVLDAIAPFLATVLVPSPWSIRVSR